MDDDSAAFAFIDESYSVPSMRSAASFYIFAVAIVSKPQARALREQLPQIVGADYFHSRELLQTGHGQRELVRICSALPESIEARIYYSEPMQAGDRLGEATRAKLLRALLEELWADEALSFAEITYEARQAGAMRQADLRTVAGLRAQLPDLNAVGRDPEHENLLWIPDLLASAFRQRHLHGRGQYLEAISAGVAIKKIALK